MLNTDLIRKIADRIEHEPDRYNQRVFIDPDEERVRWERDGDSEFEVPTPAIDCGTAFCIAGWAMAESDYLFDYTANEFMRPDGTYVTSEIHEGARLLGLHLDAAAILFDSDWRPLNMTPADALREIANSDGSFDAVHEVTR